MNYAAVNLSYKYICVCVCVCVCMYIITWGWKRAVLKRKGYKADKSNRCSLLLIFLFAKKNE